MLPLQPNRTALLARYERDRDGHYLIDVATEGVEDLYSHFDRYAPYVRRDLDPELTDYLIDAADELERNPFVIQFSCRRPVEATATERIAHSIQHYFTYLAQRERRQIARMMRRTLLLLTVGMVILFAAVWVGQTLPATRSVTDDVLAEGLTIAGWVSLWEALATVLLEWFPRTRQVRLYRRLARAPLAFRSLTESTGESDQEPNR